MLAGRRLDRQERLFLSGVQFDVEVVGHDPQDAARVAL